MRGFLCPSPMISNELTMGTPDFIIVAIWRLKNAISLGVIFFPAPPNRGFGFCFTMLGTMP